MTSLFDARGNLKPPSPPQRLCPQTQARQLLRRFAPCLTPSASLLNTPYKAEPNISTTGIWRFINTLPPRIEYNGRPWLRITS